MELLLTAVLSLPQSSRAAGGRNGCTRLQVRKHCTLGPKRATSKTELDAFVGSENVPTNGDRDQSQHGNDPVTISPCTAKPKVSRRIKRRTRQKSSIQLSARDREGSWHTLG